MDTSAPHIFLRTLALLPVRVFIVLTVMGVCLVAPLVLGGKVEETETVAQLMLSLPLVAFYSVIKSGWWGLVALVLIPYATLRGYFYVRDEYCGIELLQVGLSSFLITVWFVGQWWWVVALVGLFVLIVTLDSVRELLFRRKLKHEMVHDEAWVEKHLATVEGERLEFRQIDSAALKLWLTEAGWMEEKVAWKPSHHYRHWVREGLELIVSETDEGPEYASGDSSILEELVGVLDLLKKEEDNASTLEDSGSEGDGVNSCAEME